MTVMEQGGKLGTHLARLAKLQGELALAEVRGLLVAAAASIVVGLVAAIALIAGLVMLVASGLAPLFGARWEHLLSAGGGVVIAAAGALLWSVWRLRRLPVPRAALLSLMENWEWFVAQVRSRLTLPT